MRKLILFLFAVIALTWISGCAESDCPLNSNPMNQLQFVDSQTGEKITLLDTLTVTALGSDSILLNLLTKSSTLTLPLRYEGGETSYVFKFVIVRYDTVSADPPLKVDTLIYTVRDTLTMTYIDRKKFVSMDCGILTYFDLNGIRSTNHLMDSARIVNPAIDEYEKTNIEIYFSTGN